MNWSVLLRLLRAGWSPLRLTLGIGVLLSPNLFLLGPHPSVYTELKDEQREVLGNLATAVGLASGLAVVEDGRVLSNEKGILHCMVDPISGALVATEMYNRPAWLRRVEWLLHDAATTMGLSPPAISLGAGQIRTGVAKEVLDWAVKEARSEVATELGEFTYPEVVDLLRDPCSNARVAFLLVRRLLKEGVGGGKCPGPRQSVPRRV